MTGTQPARRPLAVVAPVHPQVSGGAQFNTAMVDALNGLGPVTALSWRRLYPPVLHRRDPHDLVSRPQRSVHAEPVLDWADPRSWRRALRRIENSGACGLVLPWIHPVMAPPYTYLLREVGAHVTRVVICHNVRPHEPVPLWRALTKSVLGRADVLVLHAGHQRAELEALGLAGQAALVQAFHPRFPAADLCRQPIPAQVASERARQGDPELSLLAFGAIRPYKGIDLALEAVARLPRRRVRLTVAGVFWDGGEDLRRHVVRLGIGDRVELCDGFVSNERAALLFAAADACILPYRSATQSGVAQLSFAHGTPVIATRVGGLPEAITDGVDGILCDPGDADALAAAIERMLVRRHELAAGVREQDERTSFRRYGELLHDALDRLPARRRAGSRAAVARAARTRIDRVPA